MKKTLIAALVAVLVLASFVSCSKKEETAESKTYIIASDCTWPPMEFINSDKEMVGYDIDFINAVAKEAGIDIEIRNTAWDGIFASLANGESDAVISSVTITEERKKTMDFSLPYINAGQVLIVPSSSSAKTLADLTGKEVGAQIGTTGAIEIDNSAAELKTYDELGFAIEDLANGRIEGVVADTPIAADYVLQNDTYKGKLMIVGDSFTDEFYGIAVKKGNTELLDLINQGINAVQDKGIDKELEDKWLR
ncbi:MAG: basic amino acid ABC transporter substrate-binding protein [Spirochaetales bacterium]|uniref:Basic amino acid ABC transporter substrate-binding protein n=1 Tax=Candidatus Thalassospirochaeta sargassi TaxID=3119039 RepID=A0AAJ1IJU4_9SPIO|nr:basic amino acid ABC transporter substrate-binding protein [Spirochaetales bacterium]